MTERREITVPQERPAVNFANIRRDLQGLVGQVTLDDPDARRAAIVTELSGHAANLVPEHAEEFRTMLERIRTEPHRDESAFLDALAERLAEFINARYSAKKFEERRRRVSMERNGFTPLNNVISYGTYDDVAHIHVAPAETMGVKEKIRAMQDGLSRLAQRLENDEALKRVTTVKGTSWIVAANPRLLERLGFTYDGLIDEEERQRHFPHETRPVGKAHISRDELLKRYGTDATQEQRMNS